MAFKMKGSPMQRNFGIGSPVKQELKKEGPHPVGSEEADYESKKKQDAKDAKLKTKALKRQGREVKPTVVVPKGHPVTPPTKEESEASKGTLKGRTGFESDLLDPIRSKWNNLMGGVKRGVVDPHKKVIRKFKPFAKEALNYFTKD